MFHLGTNKELNLINYMQKFGENKEKFKTLKVKMLEKRCDLRETNELYLILFITGDHLLNNPTILQTFVVFKRV